MHILEHDVPFSYSLLWDLQREYFETAGVTAWSTHTVPLYVTNNPALARAYAAVVAAWLEDAGATEAPLTIVELGTGPGRFTFLLLRQLELLLGEQPRLPFRYVATDFARRNVDFCREHIQLQPFRERGWLDFAVFDMERDSSLTLLDSGTVIQAGSLQAPLLVIANYVFDGLRNDAFRMQDRLLSELRLTTGCEQSALPDVEAARDAVFTFQESPGVPERYPPAWLELLHRHGERSQDESFLFPYGTLDCLERLRGLTSGHLTLLACDQYREGESFFDSEGAPRLSFHGSFSIFVNFPILRDYFEGSGGFGILPSFNYSGVVPFAAGTHSISPALRREIHRSFEAIGPDVILTLRRGFDTQLLSMPLVTTLSMLRAAGFDAFVLEHSLPSMQEHLALAMPIGPTLRADVLGVLDSCWANYYSVGEPCDLARRVAMLLYRMGEYRRALAFFAHHRRLQGDTAEVLWNIGLCHFALHELDAACHHFSQAGEISSEFLPPCQGT
jgi:hypothetical protein